MRQCVTTCGRRFETGRKSKAGKYDQDGTRGGSDDFGVSPLSFWALVAITPCSYIKHGWA